MIDGTGAELPVELFGPQTPEVLDGEGPEVQHVVPGESISLLQQHHLGPEQSQLDGRAKAARSSTDDQTLRAGKNREISCKRVKTTDDICMKISGRN